MSGTHNRLLVRAVPHIHLHTSTAHLEGADVAGDVGRTSKLVLDEVGVVGGVDVVMRQRLGHVLAHDAMLSLEEVALWRGEVTGEAIQRQVALLPALLRGLVGLDELQTGLLTHLQDTVREGEIRQGLLL